MTLQNLAPWNWGRKQVPIRQEYVSTGDPLHAFHQMNRIFDEFFRGWEQAAGYGGTGAGTALYFPLVDVCESDKEVRITAELPGMSQEDIDLSLSRDQLTIRGEKRVDKEEESQGYHRMERCYGSFQRTIALPCEIDPDKAQASFKNGVLKVVLKKPRDWHDTLKKIPIRYG